MYLYLYLYQIMNKSCFEVILDRFSQASIVRWDRMLMLRVIHLEEVLRKQISHQTKLVSKKETTTPRILEQQYSLK